MKKNDQKGMNIDIDTVQFMETCLEQEKESLNIMQKLHDMGFLPAHSGEKPFSEWKNEKLAKIAEMEKKYNKDKEK